MSNILRKLNANENDDSKTAASKPPARKDGQAAALLSRRHVPHRGQASKAARAKENAQLPSPPALRNQAPAQPLPRRPPRHQRKLRPGLQPCPPSLPLLLSRPGSQLPLSPLQLSLLPRRVVESVSLIDPQTRSRNELRRTTRPLNDTVLPPISRIRATPSPAPDPAARPRHRPVVECTSRPQEAGEVETRDRGRSQDHSHQAADHRQGSGDPAWGEKFPAHQGADGRLQGFREPEADRRA